MGMLLYMEELKRNKKKAKEKKEEIPFSEPMKEPKEEPVRRGRTSRKQQSSK